MRLLLPLIAILGLLVSPAVATSAHAKCSHASFAAGMDRAMSSKSGADPCCDKKGHGKADGKACAQTCAMSCATAAALTPSCDLQVSALLSAIPMPAAAFAPTPYEPPGLKRPPRSIS